MEACQVFLRGEIDIANTAEVVTQVWRAAADRDGEVIVDCFDITFIDVGGVEALLQIQRELAAGGRDLRLIHPSPILTRMLQVLELAELLRPIPA
jgi:anti-anti-sigma factor